MNSHWVYVGTTAQVFSLREEAYVATVGRKETGKMNVVIGNCIKLSLQLDLILISHLIYLICLMCLKQIQQHEINTLTELKV